MVILINLCPLLPKRLNVRFGFDWPGGLREEGVKNYGHTHINIALGRRRHTPGVNLFSKTYIFYKFSHLLQVLFIQ